MTMLLQITILQCQSQYQNQGHLLLDAHQLYNSKIPLPMKVKFIVTSFNDVSCQLAVVGSIDALGCWDPNKAVMLVDNNEGRPGAVIEVGKETRDEGKQKIEFKLVKKYYDGRVDWETLPNNSNRRITIREDVILLMQWSNPMGQRKKMVPRKLSSSSAPSVILNQPIKRDTTLSLDSFDPFKIAEHSDEEQERDVEKEVAALGQHLYGRKQFQELFYSNFKSQFLAKAHEGIPNCDLFVVSRLHPLESQRLNKYRQQFLKISSKVQWLVESTEGHQPKQNNISFIALRKKVGGLSNSTLRWLFQRYVDQLVPENSIVFILDDIFSCLKTNESCLKLTLTGELDQLSQSIRNDQNIEQSTKNSILSRLQNIENPLESVYQCAISQQLLKNKEKDVGSHKLLIDQFDNKLQLHQNCIMIIDWEVLEKCLEDMERHFIFLDQLRKMSWQRGKFICVISQKSRQEIQPKLAFLVISNITFILSSGREVRLNGLWLDPFQRLHRTVEVIKRRMSRYEKNCGGVVNKNQESHQYSHSNSEIVNKLTEQIKQLINNNPGQGHKYIKIDHVQNNISVSWQHDLDNVLEVILRLNCMSEGSVGFIFTIICDNTKSSMFDKVNCFTKMYPHFFTHHCRKTFACESTQKLRRGKNFISLSQLKSLKFML